MATLATVHKDTLARIANLPTTVLVNSVAITGRSLVELMTIHATAKQILLAMTVKQLIIVMIETVLITEHVITTTIHIVVHVIQDILGQIVNKLIVIIMGVRMVRPVSMAILTIRVNVLAVSLGVIVNHTIFVTIEAAAIMANVRMEKLIIPVIVNRNIAELIVS